MRAPADASTHQYLLRNIQAKILRTRTKAPSAGPNHTTEPQTPLNDQHAHQHSENNSCTTTRHFKRTLRSGHASHYIRFVVSARAGTHTSHIPQHTIITLHKCRPIPVVRISSAWMITRNKQTIDWPASNTKTSRERLT